MKQLYSRKKMGSFFLLWFGEFFMNLRKYPVNAGAPQGSIFVLMLYILNINDLPDDVICNIAICVDDTNLYSKCDSTSGLWQHLELASEIESNLQDTGQGHYLAPWIQCWKSSGCFIYVFK